MDFYKVLSENMITIGLAFGLFLLSYLANMVISLCYNMKQLKEKFSKEKLLNGLYNMLSIGISTALISLVITAVPYVFKAELSKDVQIAISITTVAILYFESIHKYLKEALDTLKQALNKEDK